MKNICYAIFFLFLLSCQKDNNEKAEGSSSQTINNSNPSTSVSTPAMTLPPSMKGYEIYSWLENKEFFFTLITGTNRNKTLEEITSAEETKNTEGFYKIRVKGVDEIKKLLELLPSGTEIFWTTLETTEGYAETEKTFDQVDPKIIEELKSFYTKHVLKK